MCTLLLTVSAKSNQNNKARLEVLKSREEHLQTLSSAAQEQLATLSKDGKAYKELLSKLLLECLLNLHEPTVEVLARSTDVQNVQSVVKDAVKQYKEMTGRETEVDVKEGLSKDSYVSIH